MTERSDRTTELLRRMRQGDRLAVDTLFSRVMPRLSRWASHRLPRRARDGTDTADIVQDTLLRSLGTLQHFESRGTGSLDAYFRQAAINRIRDEIRRSGRQPQRADMPDLPADESPLLDAIASDDAARYRRCLGRLRDADRLAITARLTGQLSYEELAAVMGKPTANAARVAVTRALVRLAAEMQRDLAR